MKFASSHWFILLFFCILYSASIMVRGEPSSSAPATSQMASWNRQSVWRWQSDQTLDGKITPEKGFTPSELQITRYNDCFVANFLGIKHDAIIIGQIIPGQMELITFKQEMKDYIVIYSGHALTSNTYQGTWLDTYGGSGDFRIELKH